MTNDSFLRNVVGVGMKRHLAHVIAAVLLLFGALGLPTALVGAVGVTYTVTSLGDTGAGSGLSGDLRYALTRVNAGAGGDTITFAVTGTIALTSALPVSTKDVTLAGPGAERLAISGNQLTRVLTIEHGVTIGISGLTITGGRTTGDAQAFGGPSGGGIFASFSVHLTLTDCVVIGNVAAGGGGGGIYVGTDSSLTLERTAVRGNTTRLGLGGGIDNARGSVRIHESTIAENVAGDGDGGSGGGIYSTGAVVIDRSTISGNIAGRSATGRGGGIAIESFHADLQITNSTVSGNTAGGVHGGGIGGGIYTSQPVRITNSTLTGNMAGTGGSDGQGGGIYTRTIDRNHRTMLTNSTIARNTATNAGGGIAANFVAALNTLVAGNIAPGGPDLSGTLPELSGTFVSRGHNLIGDPKGTTIIGIDPTDQIGIDPLLGALGDYGGPTRTLPLLPGSPAIGGGGDPTTVGTPPDASAIAMDQRGIIRRGRNDIGAFQSQGFTLAISSGNGQSTATFTAFPVPLVVIVSSSHGEPIQGGKVLFGAPSSGPSAILTGSPLIDGVGQAGMQAMANGVAGGPYAVTASAAGVAPISFLLINTKWVPLLMPAL